MKKLSLTYLVHILVLIQNVQGFTDGAFRGFFCGVFVHDRVSNEKKSDIVYTVRRWKRDVQYIIETGRQLCVLSLVRGEIESFTR